jgi:leucyl-tRNA synthetase
MHSASARQDDRPAPGHDDRPDAGYDPQAIELRRQQAWARENAFRTPEPTGARPRKYIKPSAPFTSGNVHMGHVRSYSIGDAYARLCRARGDAVLFAFGFDSFGLPAELGAIAGDEPPSAWVERCAEHMTTQLKRLGFSFDWERSFMSSDAVMYRWSQWLFLTLLEAGLVYRGSGNVDWCDTCQTTLATIQVENGRCWRCHDPVRLIERPQWYLRLSAYVPENDDRLRELAASGVWDENALASQRFVLGRIDGVELELSDERGESLTVFTPHADALQLARFAVLSPKHPDVDRWTADPQVRERLEDLRSGGLERAAREAETLPLIETGHSLASPTGGERLPLLISPVVDGRFGATAVLGVPERDATDAVIAQRVFGEPPAQPSPAQATPQQPSPRPSSPAQPSPAQPSPPQPSPPQPSPISSLPAHPAVRYRANDFSISRQRSWGTPIPIVYCERCGTVPVPRDRLPVELPLDVRPTGAGNPLAELEGFVSTPCPSCGGPARRETDTLDCHFDALWLWVPVCVPASEREMTLDEIFALEDLRAWLPCERVVAGSDSGNFVFDQRIVTKALRDIGPLAFLADGEPFAGCLFHEMVIADGRKMSKHLGNVVDPDELVSKYGADAVRLATLYAARPQKSLNWSDGALHHCHRFLRQLWEYSLAHLEPAATEARSAAEGRGAARGAAAPNGDGHRAPEMGPDKTEHLRTRLAKWCETALAKITDDATELEMHSAVRNVMRLFERIKDYEKRVIAKRGELCAEDREALIWALGLLARVLIPFAPHVGEELLIAVGQASGEPLDAEQLDGSWPETQLVAQ